MQTKVTFTYGNKSATWDEKHPNSHQHYIVKVQRGKKSTSFDFWGSVSDYQKQADPPTDEMLAAWAGDCMAGCDNFDDFCSNFGYNTDSRKAEGIYKQCVKAYNNAMRIGFTLDELSELYNKM